MNFSIDPINTNIDYVDNVTACFIIVKRLIIELLKHYPALKFYCEFDVSLRKDIEGVINEFGFFSTMTIVLQDSDIEIIIDNAATKVLGSIESFQNKGSGYIFEKIEHVCVSVTKYNPISGGSFLLLPDGLAQKHCLLNIQNRDDNFCVLWCLLAALYPVKDHPCMIYSYREHFHKLKCVGVSFPTPCSDIVKLEKQNSLRINIYGYDTETYQVFPRYISPLAYDKTVNLLLLAGENTQHYVLIKSLDALVKTKNKYGKTRHCERCLQGFKGDSQLEKHMEDCKKFISQKTVMPEEKNIYFSNIRKQLEFPIVIIADFESILVPFPRREGAKSRIVNAHEACGYAIKVISNVLPEFTQPTKVFRGSGCVDYFMEDIFDIYETHKYIFEEVVEMIMTPEDVENFKNATVCHICDLELEWGDRCNPIVKDHCHFTGKFRGAAHNNCNIQLQVPNKIPIVFHGLKNYDSHLLIRSLLKFADSPSDVYVIPNTIEKFTSIYTPEFIFLDSNQHLSSSLEMLTQNLFKKGAHCFHHLIDEFPDPNVHKHLFKKGLYPYSYASSHASFNEPIPERRDFRNDLTNSLPTEDEYQELLNMCEKLGIETLGDLHDHYVKLDVILLADIITDYRSMGMREYKLEVLYYGTAPSFSYDAMLKHTKAKPALLDDCEMYLFLERGIRGGISVISHRLATANNKFISDFEETNEHTSLFYTDCSNLYGFAMQQLLPYDNFTWLTDKEIRDLDVEKFDVEGKMGLILEVDLEYPHHIHDSHADYPVAPDMLEISSAQISDYSKQFLNSHNITFSKQKRLAPNLYDKEKYIVHIKNLQLYLSLGLVLKKIHRGIQFSQKAWLKPYIDFNTQKRQNAVSTHEKNFFKLLINSIFGKMMENVRKHKNVKFISNGRQHALYTNKPQFKRFEILSEDVVAVELIKSKIVLNKAIYCGFTILDLSKHRMFDFHYNIMKKEFKNIKLCFTDTDSLLYIIPTKDLYKDLEKIKGELDTSNYPSDHPLFDVSRKMIPGYFKDETAGIPIRQFCGLRAKCYSLILEDCEYPTSTSRTQKLATAGVKSSVHHQLNHERFLSVLLQNTSFDITQRTIISKNHNLFTVESQRVGLSALDIKRYVIDGIETLPYGHYRISE